MMNLGYVFFGFLSLACTIIQLISWKNRKKTNSNANPNFVSFQRSYLLAYLPAVVGDWLQGPYLYALYSRYGFTEDQIAIIYVSGFASTVFLGTWLTVLSNRYSSRKVLMVTTAIYAISSLMKLSVNYGVLIIARALSGLTTPIMFRTFERWYFHQHVVTYDFPKEWIASSMSKTAVFNGLLAISSGIIAHVMAEWMGYGPVAPYILAAPFLAASTFLIFFQWNIPDEATDNSQRKFSFLPAIRELAEQPEVLTLGVLEALFESSMAIFVFVWTPVLTPPSPSYGIIFSTFMICVLIGGAVYEILKKHKTQNILIIISISTSCIGFAISAFFTTPDHPARFGTFLGLLIVEIGAGIYFPSMMELRKRILPEKHVELLRAIFGVPLNLIACLALCSLHNNTWKQGNRILLLISSTLLFTAFCVALRLKVKSSNCNDEVEDEA
ncbi:unnamed protein product [Dimorphilus gyrociliatus]|uniref:Molybdate-anion transporter n=1 Tax=Dimorphilus gyrociliatus TaxID=2664684 RepID=A0A7I8W2L9_9ANNE|nr:unnamed protein product [Dimorphilus gyrociliatus]